MRRNRAQNHPALSPLGCWGWPVSSSKVLWGLKPPYHLGQEGPHGHPTGPAESWLVGYRPLSGTWSANILCHFVWQIFFLTPFVHNNFCFGKSNLSLLSFVVCAFGNRSKKSWPNPRSWGFSLMFSSMVCIILVLTSRPLIHFELILYNKGSRGPTLFFCMWDLVIPAPVVIFWGKYLQMMPPKRPYFQNTQRARASQKKIIK